MVEAPVVEVLQSRIEALEKDHAYLDQIRTANAKADEAQAEYRYAKDVSLEKKKAFDRLAADLMTLIKEGPQKPDPQGKLPFVEDSEEASFGDGGKQQEPAVQPKALAVPTEIAGLDMTDKQKQALAKTGAKSLSDLVDLGNGNWPQFPKGFGSVEGMGPKAVQKLVSQLPSTAPKVDEKPGQAPSSTVRIRVDSMAAASHGVPLQVGDMVDATLTDDGTAIVQMPGCEPYPFVPGEYQIVTAET